MQNTNYQGINQQQTNGGACPCCGYCPHCGRGYHAQPWPYGPGYYPPTIWQQWQGTMGGISSVSYTATQAGK